MPPPKLVTAVRTYTMSNVLSALMIIVVPTTVIVGHSSGVMIS